MSNSPRSPEVHEPEVHEPEVFSVSNIAPVPKPRSWKVMLPVWGVLLGLVWLGLHFGLDTRTITAGAIVFGLISSAFAWLLGLIGLLPFVGPIILKVLAIPIIWLLNAIGYLISFVAIRRGYSKDVLTYRGLTVALIVGIVIGYILGKLV